MDAQLNPRLIVITDWQRGEARLLAQLERALEAGSRVAVQHRHPEASTRQFMAEARQLASLCEGHGCELFINGRLDVALRLGTHLHLPAHGLTPNDVRPHLPAGRLMSMAVHSEVEATSARGADFALVSPVFAPGSKKGDSRPQLGPEGLRRLAAVLPCPALALGGVTPGNVAQVNFAAGAAVISGVLDAPDPREAALALLAAFS